MNFDKTALLTVDLQWSRAAGFPADVRAALKSHLDAFRAAGAPIVHALGDAALRAERLGEALDPGLAERPEARFYGKWLALGYLQRLGRAETALYKPARGAFTESALEDHLRAQGVHTVLVAGIGFAQGARATVIEAVQRGFAVVLLEDAVTEMHPLARLEAARLGIDVRVRPARRGFPGRRFPVTRAMAGNESGG